MFKYIVMSFVNHYNVAFEGEKKQKNRSPLTLDYYGNLSNPTLSTITKQLHKAYTHCVTFMWI